MNNKLIIWAFFLGVTTLWAVKTAWTQHGNTVTRQRPLLRYSIVGSSSCDKKPCYSEVMSDIAVQKFLLELAQGPQEVDVARAAMAGSAVSIADLLALRLIRREGERYFLNFALYTATDVKRIRDTSERYAESLAAAILARRTEIEDALRAYDAPGVDPKAVTYFLLGCASLDWDGLNLTAEKGYRKTTAQRPDGTYVPAAEEMSDESLEKVYWGSHNSTYDNIHLTSFGDHHSLPRFMLPDLLWRTPRFPSSYPDALKAALQELLAESFKRIGYQLGRIMLALRDGEKSGADLAQATEVKQSEVQALLHVLVALDYVIEHHGLYRARIPVLTRRDEVMARKILAIGRQVMERWLAENYESIKEELKDLSFSRSGVPFSEGVTMIWHYLFGITNRKLVEAGLFADPYATTRRYKGAIPVVYELALP
ncbi:MAG: hypothetical protein D6723_07720 [Acidobacteria bacterium]|nr:MAG: hypothetical protein D6723_07720 [Acidobacteriota bacterium]